MKIGFLVSSLIIFFISFTSFFFFKQKTAYEIKECDWSSDVCSSDLIPVATIISPPLTAVPSPVSLVGAFSDADVGDTFDGYIWYENECGTSTGTLIYEYLGAVADNPTSTPPYAFADGPHNIYFKVRDSQNSWSLCDFRTMIIGAECDDGVDSDDVSEPAPQNEKWWDDGDSGSGASSTDADPSCFDYTNVAFDPLNPLPWYDPNITTENNNPQCSDGIDNDGNGYIDSADDGCHIGFDASNSDDYNKFLDGENTCGVVTTGGVINCDENETFGSCPSDCAEDFQFIEF